MVMKVVRVAVSSSRSRGKIEDESQKQKKTCFLCGSWSPQMHSSLPQIMLQIKGIVVVNEVVVGGGRQSSGRRWMKW